MVSSYFIVIIFSFLSSGEGEFSGMFFSAYYIFLFVSIEFDVKYCVKYKKNEYNKRINEESHFKYYC